MYHNHKEYEHRLTILSSCIMKNNFFRMCIIALVSVLFSCGSADIDNTTVQSLDLNRYLGRWYEIARFDHSFERNMTHCTAVYARKPNGAIKVKNKGLKNGKWKTSNGKAKLTNEIGVLRVSFFGPFYYDYRILMLASDYSYALIGGDSDDNLWILSRTPQLKNDTLKRILNEATSRGYDTDNFIWVDQQ